MLIYIAGPYRAKNDRTVADNIAAARCAAVDVYNAGHVALTPHMNTAHLDDPEHGCTLSDEDWLRVTMDLLKRCDAILMLPGWEESAGSKAELAYAETEGMPVYHYEEGIPPLHLTEQRCPEQVDAYVRFIMRGYRTHLDKNADYSPANILGVGETGLVVRLWDKIARLLSLYGFDIQISQPATLNPPREAKNESVDDTLLDTHVYSLIGILLREGVWGK